MSTRGHSATNSSTSSFVDAPDASETLDTVVVDDKQTLREEPLSTPKVSQKQSGSADKTSELDDSAEKKNVVTIFDVATEIETMLNDINLKIDQNDKLVQEKIEKIYKTLDRIESKVRPN